MVLALKIFEYSPFHKPSAAREAQGALGDGEDGIGLDQRHGGGEAHHCQIDGV